MFPNASAIFFQLLNFASFTLFIGFLFKKYALPSIRQHIKEKKMLIHTLEQQKQDIKYLQNNLESALEQQHYIAQELTKKIYFWQSHVHHCQEEIQKQQRHIQEQMAHKKHTQQQELLLYYFNLHAIPPMITGVEEALKQEFSSVDVHTDFLKKITTFIKEHN